MLRFFQQWLSIAKFVLIVLIKTYHLLVTQTFGLKTEEKCFFVIQIPVTKIIGKTAIWTNFCFLVSPSNYTNCTFMFLMQQSHVQWRVLWNLLCNGNKFVLLETNLKNKDFTSPTQIFKLLVCAAKIVKTYIIVTQWAIACHQNDSKRPAVKYY